MVDIESATAENIRGKKRKKEEKRKKKKPQRQNIIRKLSSMRIGGWV